MRKTNFGLIAGGLAAALAGAVAYVVLLRDKVLTWGATADEVSRSLPGDELIPDPDITATRAIEIEAPPNRVWPWLVQIGSGRAGLYSYDWIENLLGYDLHSSSRILPEFQNLGVGDVVPLGPHGPRLRVESLRPGESLVLRGEDEPWSWTFALTDVGDGHTRLVSRNRFATGEPSAKTRLRNLAVIEPESLVMERKMLRGIKERAERG
ncbi:hypothetical protein FHU38_004184 [Saccharomonospora amisosensis]|uniref:Polyketide cyclase / dehydrase and lipid transport n=1 Tax=Saccharomonospora amisosensis TaxID=1128677 RepID=A0A7X5ZSY7_9PSEU|nr:SRPBCC family protein [Saccharomonospora amisosensis]NIJ13840.1 hypothetical protein [Saccharomonospora amisosensis]